MFFNECGAVCHLFISLARFHPELLGLGFSLTSVSSVCLNEFKKISSDMISYLFLILIIAYSTVYSKALVPGSRSLESLLNLNLESVKWRSVSFVYLE